MLDKDENLSWSGLQWHRSCHSNEMTPLPILLAAIFLGTGNCSYKIVHFFLSYGRICKSVIEIFWDEVFIARNTVKQEDLDVWPLFVANEALLTMQFRGGSRRRVQGVRTPSPSWDDLRFSNTTGILQKKKNCVLYWCWSRARDECTPS